MSLAEDFEDEVTDLIFLRPETVTAPNGAKSVKHVQAFAETKKGIFQMTAGSVTYTPNGMQQRTTNDAYADKDADTDAMYQKIRVLKEEWRIQYEGLNYAIVSIDGAGAQEDPYVMEVRQVS
jgi:hypothetical protein